MSTIALDPNAAGYFPSNAFWLARAAALAYRAQPEIEAETRNWGLARFSFYSMSAPSVRGIAVDTQAFVAANDSVIVVAFRGTEPGNIRDWFSDARLIQVRGPAGRVHLGFRDALDAVWASLRTTIMELRDNRQTLWITGHSLGAALATLATARLRLEHDEVVNGLYTFGSPRVGDSDFEREFNGDFKGKTFRVVHNNDIVPRVPFRTLRYSHVGMLAYYDSNKRLQVDLSWWEKLLDRIEGRIDDLLDPGTDGIKDHSMIEYMACIANSISPVAD